MQSGVELNRAYHCNLGTLAEVSLHGGNEVTDVDTDVDKDVQSLYLGNIDGYQAAVGVVNENIAAQSTGCVIVDTASAICDISHDESADAIAKLRQNIGDGGRE